MIELTELYGIGLSLLLGLLIGWEREKNDKPCGLRTVAFISLGATLSVIITLRLMIMFEGLNVGYDGSRILAYYLVAIGFVGGGIITRIKSKVEGITTASLLLPVSLMGILCGMGEYSLAILSGLLIYFILKLKYLKIKVELRRKK